MYLALSMFLSCVVSLILPIDSISRNFSVIPAGRNYKITITSRRGQTNILLSRRSSSLYFSWYRNDGVGTERNTNRPLKIG